VLESAASIQTRETRVWDWQTLLISSNFTYRQRGSRHVTAAITGGRGNDGTPDGSPL
jgi:hypothetical protein